MFATDTNQKRINTPNKQRTLPVNKTDNPSEQGAKGDKESLTLLKATAYVVHRTNPTDHALQKDYNVNNAPQSCAVHKLHTQRQRLTLHSWWPCEMQRKVNHGISFHTHLICQVTVSIKCQDRYEASGILINCSCGCKLMLSHWKAICQYSVKLKMQITHNIANSISRNIFQKYPPPMCMRCITMINVPFSVQAKNWKPTKCPSQENGK